MSRLSGEELSQVQSGLRMAHPPDPEELAAERQFLVSLEDAPWFRRNVAYFKLIGPGYLQSAMTLGRPKRA